MASTEFSRRHFLSRTGTLVVGFALAPLLAPLATSGAAASAATTVPDLKIDSWLEIGAANTVTLYSGKVELGTGVQTALTQIVAEELAVNVDQVVFVQGDTALTPGDKGYTAGSKTVQNEGPSLRLAAATAFQALLALASQQIGVPTQALRAQDGRIGIGHNLNRARTYAQLLGQQQLQLASNPAVAVKDAADYTVVGQPVARVDLPDKFLARFTYVQDVTVPGMVHGRMIRPAGRNATFGSIDPASLAAAQAIPGFLQVVQRGNVVGVVAATEYAAIVAARTLKVAWNAGAPLIPQASLAAALQDPANAYQSGNEVNIGDVDAALATASATATATYFTPFHMHAAVGPSCAVADVRAAQATIWSGTQGVFPLQGALAGLLGLSADQVHVVYVEAAGCYGHNGADDAAADAALLSQAVGKPVRVQWTRQEEHGWEPLGPAMLHRMRGGLDSAGGLVAWEHTVFTPTHNCRPGGNAGNTLAGQEIGALPSPLPAKPTNAGTRNAPVTYSFSNNRLVEHQVRSFNGIAQASGAFAASAPLTYTLPRSTALRSLGGFSNTFANESFMDELAARAGADPLAFRLAYTTDPRAVAVLQAMARQAGWANALPPGPGGLLRGRGIAFLRYETVEAYVAAYAEVLVNPATGAVQVTRVVVAHDCGLIINPDGLRNQIEGNVIQGISRTLKEEVQYDDNGVTSVVWAQNSFFPTAQYPVITFAEVPTIEIVLLDRPTEVAWGAGEPTIGAMPGAIGNAICNATGVRLRTLPLTPTRVLAALAAG